MDRIRLIHWNAVEADERADQLRAAGYEVSAKAFDADGWKVLKGDPPAAVVIDLSRLPSQGRDLALTIRKTRATRYVPLVFVDGEHKKVERIKELLPDAIYTNWSRIRKPLQQAIANPPLEPVVPRSVFDGYSGKPLPSKLGIKAASVVVLIGAPEGFEETLGELPEGVVIRRGARGKCNVVLWFAKSQNELERRIERIGEFMGDGSLWIIWPKKASKVASDLSQVIVRRIGLAAGLVDYKVCSIDATFSGLCFTRRKSKPR